MIGRRTPPVRPRLTVQRDDAGRPTGVTRGTVPVAARGAAPPPAGLAAELGVTRLTATAALVPGPDGRPAWTICVTCPETGVVVQRRGVAPGSRIGRALGGLARLLAANGGGA